MVFDLLIFLSKEKDGIWIVGLAELSFQDFGLAGLMLARFLLVEGTLVDVGLAELRSRIFWIGWTSWRSLGDFSDWIG